MSFGPLVACYMSFFFQRLVIFGNLSHMHHQFLLRLIGRYLIRSSEITTNPVNLTYQSWLLPWSVYPLALKFQSAQIYFEWCVYNIQGKCPLDRWSLAIWAFFQRLVIFGNLSHKHHQFLLRLIGRYLIRSSEITTNPVNLASQSWLLPWSVYPLVLKF